MARRKSRKNRKFEASKEPFLHQETKDSIIAIVSFVVALLFIFAWFGNAGRIGGWVFSLFSMLFGRGYFLFPLALVLVAGALLFSVRPKFASVSLAGGLVFLLSSLALAEILFETKTGGVVGYIVAYPFSYFFDNVLAGLMLTAGIIASLLVIFNFSLRRVLKEKDSDEDELEESSGDLNIKSKALDTLVEKNSSKVSQEEVEPVRPKKDDSRRDVAPEILRELKHRASDYSLPPLNLLEADRGKPSAGDIKANGNIIQRTLMEFGIPVEMGEVNIGPSVTQYTLKPAQGVKLSKIIGLHNDLALALAAHPLRIEAPIPGRSFVGIEIPNKSIAYVGLRHLLEQDEYQKGGPLMFALGKNVAGQPMYADLARMPHMLIAGATGTGKSVNIHSVLMSLLYKNTPLSLRLLMIDPKRVELAHYHDIPHLLTPVITNAKDAISSLRWAVTEMEDRYKTLENMKCRDIISYNSQGEDFMPYIVIIIDELADLMASFGREAEASIVRLAQMARAVGIHLVVSTQRPSVEVITGLIKANITSRIAFQVASQVDSRTILDGAGADKLLGNGDMLYLAGDAGKPKRIQGAFVSENEVKKVTKFIRDQETDLAYNEEVINTKVNAKGEFMGEDADDELYDVAYEAVLAAGKASTSYLQRRLKVGYARAARLIDMLEERGVVGPGEGAKPREILVDINVEKNIQNERNLS